MDKAEKEHAEKLIGAPSLKILSDLFKEYYNDPTFATPEKAAAMGFLQEIARNHSC